MPYIQRANMAEKKNKRFGFGMAVAMTFTVVVLLLAGAYIWRITPRPYSAVILASGDVYFGQLSYFPRLSLSDPYTLQTVADPNNPEQVTSQIVPLDLLVWSPNKLFLNRDQVISISRVGEDSQVMQLIRSRNVTQ